jgi:Fe-S cluster assembly ATPase SufC
MLQVTNLVVQIEDKRILNGLNLTVNDGEVAAIMGPNGSGKSTLSYVVAGKADYEVWMERSSWTARTCSRWSRPSGRPLASSWPSNTR